jgi:hypothetical protein
MDVNGKTGDHGLPENHVRLVRILPGRKGLVPCETRVFALPMSTGYTAISYAWGPPVAKQAIELNGRRHLVPKNLWHFLTAWCRLRFRVKRAADGPLPSEGHVKIRDDATYTADQEQEETYYPTEPHSNEFRPLAKDPPWKCCYSWLWIHALSIDQNNMQERSHQVKIMSRIFGGADEVLVWLGRDTRGLLEPRSLLSCIRELAHNGPTVHEICDRMYWTRLWVFQELRSARQISLMCGDEVILFAELAGPLNDPVPEFPEYQVRSRGTLRHSAAARMVQLCGQNTPTSLWLLLQLTQHLHCYDSRDKVYALLSMAKSGRDGIDADYIMPLPELMNRILRNLYSTSQPPCASDVAVRCARLKAMMGLEPGFPWGASDYLAAERLAHPSTDPA